MYHMSITVQEAYLLADILDRHLDDYVEELTREKFSNPNTDQTKSYTYYRYLGLDNDRLTRRDAAVSLRQKANETIQRSQESMTYQNPKSGQFHP